MLKQISISIIFVGIGALGAVYYMNLTVVVNSVASIVSLKQSAPGAIRV